LLASDPRRGSQHVGASAVPVVAELHPELHPERHQEHQQHQQARLRGAASRGEEINGEQEARLVACRSAREGNLPRRPWGMTEPGRGLPLRLVWLLRGKHNNNKNNNRVWNNTGDESMASTPTTPTATTTCHATAAVTMERSEFHHCCNSRSTTSTTTTTAKAGSRSSEGAT
jgi:hypothetical protein